MRNKPQMLSRQCLSNFAWLALALSASIASASGGIATDGTMGAELTLSGASITIPQDLGATAGNNLFHSFAEFNIASGQTVEFTGSDALQNVISRVTGTDATAIDGTLKSSIANAAFYFINPNGIAFGANAQVDVPGAFHIGTADKIDFPNGGVFYADSNRTGTLSSEAPSAFGFIATSTANNGLIDINGARLNIKTGQTLDMAAGKITLENGAALSAPAGEIRLLAMQDQGTVSLVPAGNDTLPLPAVAPSASNSGNITLENSTVSVNGNGGGNLSIWGDTVAAKNSHLNAGNDGDLPAGSANSVALHARNLSVDHSDISADALGTGQAGSIFIHTGHLNIARTGYLSSGAGAGGNAAAMTVLADSLKIHGCGFCLSSTGIFSDAKVLTIQARSLDIKDGYIGAYHSTADADNVLISADNIHIANSADDLGNSGIFATAKAMTVKAKTLTIGIGGEIALNVPSTGQPGILTVNADTLNITGTFGGGIVSHGNEHSNAGTLYVNAGTLQLIRGGQISSSSDSDYQGGNVIVTANLIDLDGKNGEDLSTDAHISSYGGAVTVKAKTLALHDRASISATDFKDSGDVEVIADTIKIYNNAYITSEGLYSDIPHPNPDHGRAGNITVTAKTLDIFNRAGISSSTSSNHRAGYISVTADVLSIDGHGGDSIGQNSFTGIFSEADRDFNLRGHAGNITINARSLGVLNGGVISSTTFAAGKAGTIRVNADSLKIDPQHSNSATGILSEAYGNILGPGGDAGTLIINAKTLEILNGGLISSSTFSAGSAGHVRVDASLITLDNSVISAAAQAGSGGLTGDMSIKTDTALHLFNHGKISIENAGNAVNPAAVTPGKITVSAPAIDMKDSEISTLSTGNMAAGNIGIDSELITLQNSGFTTTASGTNSQGNGGNISATADVLVMDSGLIRANAVGGFGGDIALNLKTLIPSANTLLLGGAPVQRQTLISGFNVIQAASEDGVSGKLSVTAPQLNLSGILANLGGPQFEINPMSLDNCDQDAGGSLSHRGAGGLKPKNSDLQF